MIDSWSLPTSATIGGVKYTINADYRDILEIVKYLNDFSKPDFLRWQIAIGLFFDGDIPVENQREAMEYLAEFISYGEVSDKPSPKMLDWEQDAKLIISDVNAVAKTEIRALPFLHWWTFLAYFYSVGEGQLSTVVSIRNKRRKGKKLEKWEEEFYKENKDLVEFKKKGPEDIEVKKYFEKWL